MTIGWIVVMGHKARKHRYIDYVGRGECWSGVGDKCDYLGVRTWYGSSPFLFRTREEAENALNAFKVEWAKHLAKKEPFFNINEIETRTCDPTTGRPLWSPDLEAAHTN